MSESRLARDYACSAAFQRSSGDRITPPVTQPEAPDIALSKPNAASSGLPQWGYQFARGSARRRFAQCPKKWRRRESNPRPQPHRMSIYKLRLPFDFARRPECSRPTVALAILQCRASGDWLSLGAEPVSWRRSGPRAQLGGASPTSSYELGSECEITRIRI
jgi:hypothetical protein